MKKNLIEDIDLNEFNMIIVNVNSESQLCSKQEESKNKEYTKDLDHEILNEENVGQSASSKIYSIKDITKSKTEIQIIEIIKDEIGVVRNDAITWNNMIKAISKVSLTWDPPIKGRNIIAKAQVLYFYMNSD